MKKAGRIILGIAAIPVTLVAGAAWLLWGGVSNPAGRDTIGDIRPPLGYERVDLPNGSFGAFIREFPLKERGSHMHYYDGSLAYGQYFGYAVLDLPMISGIEQCADGVMRIRAEYLYGAGRYVSIHFHSVDGKDMHYRGGADRNALEKYLRQVYGSANTASLRREMKPRDLHDIAPGDVLVYEARSARTYGHAVLVADVAVNRRTGKKAVMLVQSSTPALTMHVIRDILHPVRSPWVILDPEDDGIFISGIRFGNSDLRTWDR